MGRTRSGFDALRLEEMDRLFAELAGMGSFRLGLTGGEPLLRKDLLEILDAATAHGLHPCLTTNGLLLDERMARELGRRPLVWLNVSLDGATATTNDCIRGDGTFGRVIEKVGLLRGRTRFTLAFTITTQSAPEVAACANLARSLGAHAAVFRPLYPVGTARRNLDLMPTYAQYADALQTLTGDSHAYDPFSPQSRTARQGKVCTNGGCGAGNLVCSISVRGDVNPCSFLGSVFESGNVREHPFAEIWHEGERFREMRRRSGEEFAGGCRARALVLNRSVHAPDPWHDEWLAWGGLHPMTNAETEA